jgi:predicted transcriptional regulator
METTTSERVLRFVALRPGASTASVASGTQLDETTADYHLRKLRKAGMLVTEKGPRMRCWFPANRGFCPVLRRAVPALARPEALAIARALDDLPRTATDVADRAGVSVGEVRWAATVLEQALLLQKSRAGLLTLREGADVCRGKAASAEPCDRWGRCPMAEAWARRMAATGNR